MTQAADERIGKATVDATRDATAAAVVRAYVDAVARRDLESMAVWWSDEVVDDVVPVGVLRGAGEVRGFFAELFTALPDSELEVVRMTADERVVVVEWRLRGTFAGGPFQGFAPTGSRIQLRGVDCVEVERGRIVRNTAYYDGAAFARAIGMLPPRASRAERALLGVVNALGRVRAALRAGAALRRRAAR